jgi:deoxyribodipyrimidine photolyase-like uncharacterized protein
MTDEYFGAYEDAIPTQHATINHSAVTPMLNLGLLDPRDVIDRVLARRERVPLNSLEGFVRQVIGWREFIRSIYQHRGTAIRNTNFWHFDRPMPHPHPPTNALIGMATCCFTPLECGGMRLRMRTRSMISGAPITAASSIPPVSR